MTMRTLSSPSEVRDALPPTSTVVCLLLPAVGDTSTTSLTAAFQHTPPAVPFLLVTQQGPELALPELETLAVRESDRAVVIFEQPGRLSLPEVLAAAASR